MMNIIDYNDNNYAAKYMHNKYQGKPSLVFLVGSLQEIESVQVFNKAFSKHFDYWVVELPGSGNTEPLHPSHDVFFLANYLKRMVERLSLDQFHLVACSYATAVALEFSKLCQEKINGLVLAGSMMNIPLQEWPRMLQLMRDCTHDTHQFANGFIDLLTDSSGAINRLDVIRKAAVRKASHYREEHFWHFVFNTIRLMCYEPKDLHLISAPTLVFTGEYDPYVTPDRSKRLASAIPHAESVVIQGCDHLFHIEKPDETINLILNFLVLESSSFAA